MSVRRLQRVVREEGNSLIHLRTVRLLWLTMVRLVCALAIAISFYLLTALIGLFPVNNSFVPADKSNPESVTIYVRSDGVHADIILPTSTEVVDWREYFPRSDFRLDTTRKKYVAIGWGDRGFYLNTPTWDDLTYATTARAILLPSKSVLHVSFTSPVEDESCKSTTISTEQYHRLVEFVLASMDMKADSKSKSQLKVKPKPKPIDAKYSYSWNDRFYDANGSYHAFNTCNCWVGRALRHCGIRTAWFTPLPRSVFAHWPAMPRRWPWLLLIPLLPVILWVRCARIDSTS